MPHTPTPWVGLAALVAMFVLPFLPSWLFDGPRTVKHWPRRHVCGVCNAPWTEGHVCATEITAMTEVDAPLPEVEADAALHGEIRRLTPYGELERHPGTEISRRA